MSRKSTQIAATTIGIDIGKNTFDLVGLDHRGPIVLQLKVSRRQLEWRFANVPNWLIGHGGLQDQKLRPWAIKWLCFVLR